MKREVLKTDILLCQLKAIMKGVTDNDEILYKTH